MVTQFNYEEDGEDQVLAKATLMIDHSPDASEPLTVKPPAETNPKYYMQGVVQGKQAYIITNLLGGDSQTLVQSQMVWTIGRNREAALPLRDRVLSRRHALILFVHGEGFYLVDLNSMNGSFLNGKRVEHRQLLKDGDRLRLGNIEFNFLTSKGTRMISPIHPEVLARFTSSKSHSGAFIDFLALEEPEVLFNTINR